MLDVFKLSVLAVGASKAPSIKTQAVDLYTTPTHQELSFSSHLQHLFHLTMLAWNLNLHLRFRLKFSSRSADMLFPLKVVLLVLIILIILSSRSPLIGIIFWLFGSQKVPGGFMWKMHPASSAQAPLDTLESPPLLPTLLWVGQLSKKAACILFAALGLGTTSRVSFFFSDILKKLSVDQTVYSQHATFINLHLISFEIKLSFSHGLMTLHSSPLFLVLSYLMASIEEPQLMTKLFLADPWAHQLGSHRVAKGSAFLRQGCSSGHDL